jgi:uncharacterized protein
VKAQTVLPQAQWLKARSDHVINRDILVSAKNNPLLLQILDLVDQHQELQTLWQISNVHAVKRLGYTDHGPIHFQLVAQTALQMLRLLMKRKVLSSVMNDFHLTPQHAEVIVVLAGFFHDIGMSVHRNGHEEFSVILANTMLKEMLSFLPIAERTVVISEVLHAIISHRRAGQPLTIEAGIVRVADALDMTNGRSRIPYHVGQIDIHSVSAMSIDEVNVRSGKRVPIEVDIVMNHTAGIFQVDELLKEKVKGSGIEQYLDIKVYIEKDNEKQLFKDFYQQR